MENKVKIEFDLNKIKLEKLHQIETLLAEVGITFDVGIDISDNIRDWEFDWSLKGPIKVIVN